MVRTEEIAAAMIELNLRLILPNGGVRCAHHHPTGIPAMLCGLRYDIDGCLGPFEGIA